MIRVLLADDEPLALRGLVRALADVDDVEIIGCAPDGDSALSRIRTLRPDLVILDVEMPGLSGMGVAAALEGDGVPDIIFLTAFDHYATAAFEVEAVDYLLKPLRPDRLGQALQRARRRMAQRSNLAREAHLPAFDKVILPGVLVPHLHLPDRHGGRDIAQTDIVWIEAAKDYALIHTETCSHILRTTMTDLVSQLRPELMRVHRSAFVALDRVKRGLPSGRGVFTLVLQDGVEVSVGPNYTKAVRLALQNMPLS